MQGGARCFRIPSRFLKTGRCERQAHLRLVQFPENTLKTLELPAATAARIQALFGNSVRRSVADFFFCSST